MLFSNNRYEAVQSAVLATAWLLVIYCTVVSNNAVIHDTTGKVGGVYSRWHWLWPTIAGCDDYKENEYFTEAEWRGG